MLPGRGGVFPTSIGEATIALDPPGHAQPEVILHDLDPEGVHRQVLVECIGRMQVKAENTEAG